MEDKVSARVTRDVRVGARVAIPAGSIVTGSVTEVDRGGKMKGKARLAVRFHTVTLADGTQLAIRTDAVVREGESPARETAAKVGGAAIGGAILGAILGGGKGAAIGAGVGAAGGTAASMANDRNAGHAAGWHQRHRARATTGHRDGAEGVENDGLIALSSTTRHDPQGSWLFLHLSAPVAPARTLVTPPLTSPSAQART